MKRLMTTRRGAKGLVAGFIMAGVVVACARLAHKDDLSHLPYQPHPVVWTDPPGFVSMAIPADNPFTEEGIALGRALFYDPILSFDSTFSCASCHQSARAFTDAKSKSVGMRARVGRRSSPSLLNVGYLYKGLFWDGRSPHLEDQALHPVVDSLEMGYAWEVIEERLRNHPDYPQRFRAAFGIGSRREIDRRLTTRALAQFQRTLLSYNSKFDRVMRKEDVFTASEKRGWTIFFDASQDAPNSECNHCHIDPLFTDLSFANNGLDPAPTLTEFPDAGRGGITGLKPHNGQFKVPTLRNIALTAPYMHDGRFRTLEQVVDHYVSGGHYAENVNPNVRKLSLDAQDKADLIAFLHTLTDSVALFNRAYANPFTLQ
jgi:cytochrome c peroxidase